MLIIGDIKTNETHYWVWTKTSAMVFVRLHARSYNKMGQRDDIQIIMMNSVFDMVMHGHVVIYAIYANVHISWHHAYHNILNTKISWMQQMINISVMMGRDDNRI